MAENPMSDQEFKKLRRFIKPFSRLNTLVYKLTGGRLMGKLQACPSCCWASPARSLARRAPCR